ncbi:hypothetical protein [Aureivirga sp. CE67]|uniref:hypothetical protein n=1 Tax=Aureivirga sp. CE67 TaxID=1788983 RepID=UPI0018CB17C6|nr:hypothetical protein [Aureivirga sp. CE67]
MKKDIFIPKVENVYMAIVKEFNETYQTEDWNVYLINDRDTKIDMVICVSQGTDPDSGKITTMMRKTVQKMEAHSFAKVEYLQEDVLALDNIFNVTFFDGNTMYDKQFVFEKNTVKEGTLRYIKLLDKKGVIRK